MAKQTKKNFSYSVMKLNFLQVGITALYRVSSGPLRRAHCSAAGSSSSNASFEYQLWAVVYHLDKKCNILIFNVCLIWKEWVIFCFLSQKLPLKNLSPSKAEVEDEHIQVIYNFLKKILNAFKLKKANLISA